MGTDSHRGSTHGPSSPGSPATHFGQLLATLGRVGGVLGHFCPFQALRDPHSQILFFLSKCFFFARAKKKPFIYPQLVGLGCGVQGQQLRSGQGVRSLYLADIHFCSWVSSSAPTGSSQSSSGSSASSSSSTEPGSLASTVLRRWISLLAYREGQGEGSGSSTRTRMPSLASTLVPFDIQPLAIMFF